MLRKIVLMLAAAAVVAAGVALAPHSLPLSAGLHADNDYGQNKPRYLKGRLLADCFDEGSECGLVVW